MRPAKGRSPRGGLDEAEMTKTTKNRSTPRLLAGLGLLAIATGASANADPLVHRSNRAERSLETVHIA